MGAPEAGLVFHDFNQLFKGLMADDQFRARIEEGYPESAMTPCENRPRFAKACTNPAFTTFEEVCANYTYEEVVRWCWQQGGYRALQFYLGAQGQNCVYDSTGMDACAFAEVHTDN